MITKHRAKQLVVIACASVSLTAAAQMAPSSETSRLDLTLTYSPTDANIVGGSGFWMHGSSLQAQYRLRPEWGVVADFTGVHAASTPKGSIGLDLLTATVGPRYTWSPSSAQIAFFGEALVGSVHGMHSLFPTDNTTASSANSFALMLGGGADIAVSNRLRIRAVQADWLRTQLPNSTTNLQNNVRLGVGLVYTIGNRHVSS